MLRCMILLYFVIALYSACTFAQEVFELNSGGVQTEVVGSLGYCPCVLYKIEARAFNGKVNIGYFVISSDTLVKIQKTFTPFPNRSYESSRLATLGQVDVVLQNPKIGIGFSGVEFGRNLDQGYSEIIRMGASVLIHFIQNQNHELTFRSGYENEQLEINFYLDESRNKLPQTLTYKWEATRWKGRVAASVVSDVTEEGISRKLSKWGHQGSVKTQRHLFKVLNFQWDFGMQFQYQYDGWRTERGLHPYEMNLAFFLEAYDD